MTAVGHFHRLLLVFENLTHRTDSWVPDQKKPAVNNSVKRVVVVKKDSFLSEDNFLLYLGDKEKKWENIQGKAKSWM